MSLSDKIEIDEDLELKTKIGYLFEEDVKLAVKELKDWVKNSDGFSIGSEHETLNKIDKIFGDLAK